MRYKVLLQKGNYALIQRGKNMDEYAVVSGIKEPRNYWDYDCCYHSYHFGNRSNINKTEALSFALDDFCMITEENYIPRLRLIKLAIQFKDELNELLQYDKDSEREFFDEVCEMTDEEKEFFKLSEREGK